MISLMSSMLTEYKNSERFNQELPLQKTKPPNHNFDPGVSY